jgi:DNA-binding beta-propeller fold protein YncE
MCGGFLLRRRKMKKSLTICLMLLVVFALKVRAQEPLKLVARTPMPGFSGDFDHFAVDLKGHRLFLAAEEHKTVEVFDLRTGKRIHSITGFGDPHMMVYLPNSNNLIVTDGDSPDDPEPHFGMVELVSGKDYKILGTIKLPPIVDHAVFNPVNKYYYVQSGTDKGSKTHMVNIIDTKTFKHVGDIDGIPGEENEAMTIDRAGKKLYLNLTGTDEVGVIDLNTRQLIARWPLPDAHVAHGIALDESNHRLFTATRKPPKFIAFDTDTGKVIADLPCVDVNSDMWFDAAHKRIYVTGSETTSVFKQIDADHYEHVTEVATAYRAKSSILVPQLNRLYVAVSSKGKAGAQMALQIYDAQP